LRRAYECAPVSEPEITSFCEVQPTTKGFKFLKAPVPNDDPKRVLRHLPKCAIRFLTKALNAVLHMHTSSQQRNTLAWYPY
jgi:hypothetical protein